MDGPQIVSVVLVALTSYLAGAIPFSYIAGRAKGGIDLRRHGSGNLGASNTYRLLGGKIASAVLLGDVAKGFFPVHFAPSLGHWGGLGDHWLMLVAAFFAVTGHMFSVFVRFSGGKGVATSAGAFLALSPLALLITAVIFAGVFAARRIVSLASITCAVLLPLIVWVLDRTGLSPSHWSLFAVSVAIVAVMLVKHRENIRRLLDGEERALQRIKR